MKREVAGSGTGAVGVRGQQVTTPAGGSIALQRGSYELALRFDVPRSQVVDYTVTCGELVTIPGSVGETFERYRERRLGELRAMADRDRKAMSAVTGTLVSAAAPNVRVRGQAVGPNGSATVEGNVSGQAVGDVASEAIANTAIADIVELAPGDVGAARYQRSVNLTIGADATCTINALADDASVISTYDVTRIRNLKQEAHDRRVTAEANAQLVRGQLTAQLEVAGADRFALQRRREADARARAEAEAARQRARLEVQAKLDAERDARQHARLEMQAKVDAERAARKAAAQAKADAALHIRLERERAEHARADAERASLRAKLDAEAHLKVSIEQRRRSQAFETRSSLIGYLAVECHADPRKREREREAIAEQERRRTLKVRLELDARTEREARLRVELDARNARLRAEQDARDATLRAEHDARDATLRAEHDARLALVAEQQRLRDEDMQRRAQVALSVRGQLQASLVAMGARLRPPMPALIAETPGLAPFDGAVWLTGQWRWTGGEWSWVRGGWQDTTRFGSSGLAGGAVVTIGTSAAASVNIEPPPYTDPTIRQTQEVEVRLPSVRDQRGTASGSFRDHRGESTKVAPPPAVTPASGSVRDHRANKDDDKTKKASIRDHRR